MTSTAPLDTMAQTTGASEPEEPGGGTATPTMSRTTSRTPELRRRTSLEEDYFYREVMTVSKKPTEPPPTYESTMKKIRRREREETILAAARAGKTSTLKLKGKEKYMADTAAVTQLVEVLPAYSCDIDLEGLFQRKMEIENATKRAEDRRWNATFVVLRGTVLEIYKCRKDRSLLGLTARGGPQVSPDRPPWLRKGELLNRYSLAYADVGIAADYVKRRYVIRVRAESDQFLLSCVELETFVCWLDSFFAALSIAVPIDERDFPRDQSIPRMQRVRWYQGRDRDAEAAADQEREQAREMEIEQNNAAEITAEMRRPSHTGSSILSSSRSTRFGERITARQEEGGSGSGSSTTAGRRPSQVSFASITQTTSRAKNRRNGSVSSASSNSTVGPSVAGPSAAAAGPSTPSTGPSRALAALHLPSNAPTAPMAQVATRLSTTTYPHVAVDATTGKWQPQHRWTKTHDMVYAKLCYATLLFRSPRKSNYIIMKGKQWFVDWRTGDMFRVSPPRYGEFEPPGPWQILRTENPRI